MNEKAEWKEQKEKTYFDSHDKTHQAVEESTGWAGRAGMHCARVVGWAALCPRKYRVDRVIVCNFDLKVQQPAIYHSTQRHKSMSMLNQKIKGRKQKERENGRERMREVEGGRVRAVS